MHPMNISEKSRTFNVTRNAGWAMVLHLLTILCQFVSRTIFIRLLGIDYLGINDLFNNVLMILSLYRPGNRQRNRVQHVQTACQQ